MARITFAPVIYSQYKRKDGNYSVKMRITFKQKSKYITTSEVASPSQLTKKLAVKDPELKNRLLRLETRMREAVSDLDMYALEQMQIGDIITHISRRINGDFRLDFLAFWPVAVADKPKGSRENYMVAFRAFQRFLGVETLDISKVTSRLMREYESYLEKKHGKGARAVTMYTAAVKHVHSLARKTYNTDEAGEFVIRNPFDFYAPPKQLMAANHRDIDLSLVQQMIDKRQELDGRERRAVDAFLLSFALMGMNAPDMLDCRPPKKGVLVYNRQKTRDHRLDRAEMHVRIEPCVMPLYGEWADDDGTHAFTFHRFHGNFKQFTWALAKGLKKYRARVGIPDGELDFYSARHTWATTAYNIGINEGIVNDCLCHSDQNMKITNGYIRKDWSVLWEANRKVLALLNWPQ